MGGAEGGGKERAEGEARSCVPVVLFATFGVELSVFTLFFFAHGHCPLSVSCERREWSMSVFCSMREAAREDFVRRGIRDSP